MARMIFVNLPVADLARSVAFYEAVGARNDPRFSGNGAAMMSLDDAIHVMLMTHERFAGFTPKTIVDAHDSVQVLLNLSADSRAEVDATIDRAVRAGGKPDPAPIDEIGDFLYGRSFDDPDGHGWGVMWMDVDKAVAAMAPAAEPA